MLETTPSTTNYTKEGLASTEASPRQRQIALFASIFLVLGVVGILPFSSQLLATIPSFVPATVCPVIFINLIIAYLLFSQFLGTHTPSLAALAGSYVYSSMILIPYILTFPGAFLAFPASLLHAGPQTASWLWVFWHAGFPLGIIVYILIDKLHHATRLSTRHTHITVITVVCAIPAFVALLSAIIITFPSLLPPLITGQSYSTTMITTGIEPLTLGVNALAYIGTLLLIRRGTMLQVWLRVVALVSLLDVLLSFLSLNRYSLGWYTSRTSSLIEGTVLLCALLYEVNHLYKRLAHQNDELLKQHAIQNNFISVVSHEFRTALTSIQGFSEIMLNEEFSPAEAREFAGDMNSDAHRISRLIGELLDLDRMKSGTMKLMTEQVAVNMLIENVISRMRPTTSRHLIRCELDPTIPLLWGDHDKLVQVLTNLINNAIKYSPDGGEILVKNWREKETFHLTVRDHGMGIPPDQLEMVFERYTRVESTKSRYVSGTGLGLPIVRQIIQMHGGQTWAESTPNQGTTFHITLPLARTPVLTPTHA